MTMDTQDIVALTEALNEIDLIERRVFGDAVNASIVRNVKAADLKGRPISLRGLARVVGLQPSTIRRRVAALQEQGWVRHDETGLHYMPEAGPRGERVAGQVFRKISGLFRSMG